jgi:hypothetical protein
MPILGPGMPRGHSFPAVLAGLRAFPVRFCPFHWALKNSLPCVFAPVSRVFRGWPANKSEVAKPRLIAIAPVNLTFLVLAAPKATLGQILRWATISSGG